MISNLTWVLGYGYDMHLLPGDKTGDMLGNIKFTHNDKQYNGSDSDIPENITIAFNAYFKDSFHGAHGVSVNSSTGEIQIADDLPVPRLYNFIYEVVVLEDGANYMTLEMRVHIHQSVKKIWLTPSTLTLYAASTKNTRFSVYAEFDDEVYGDITDHGLLGFQLPLLRLKYSSSNEGNVQVDELGFLSATTPNVSAEITVTYGPSPAPDNLKSTGTVNTKMPLSHPRKITRINPIGKVEFTKKTNVLFIQEGYDNKSTFNKIVSEIVKGFQTDPYLFPYSLLKDSINYWRIDDADYMESVEKGSTVLGEWFKTTLKGGITGYRRLEPPMKPYSGSSNWDVSNLAYAVGLPVKADKENSFEQQIEIWKQLYDDVEEDKISESEWRKWLDELGTRTLINERDTSLGLVAHGNYQGIGTDFPLIHFNYDRRISWDEFKVLLENLQYDGQTVGTTWTVGKDKGCICLLGRNEIGQAFFSTPYFLASNLGLYGLLSIKKATGGKRGIDLVPKSLTNTLGELRPLHPLVIPGLSHELGHAFGLGDEYAFNPFAPNFGFDITARHGNLMSLTEDLFSGDPPKFNTSEIKWNWYRIKAVGILTKEPHNLTAGKFEVSLEPDHVANFKKGDIVRFRRRDLAEYDPYSRARFEVSNIPDPNPNNTIEVSKLSSDSFDADEFPAASLLVKTVQGKPASSGAIGEDLKMIAPIIQNHLEKGNIALNVEPPAAGTALEPCYNRPHDRTNIVPKNLPAGLPAKIKNKEYNIVGIFEGGARYWCEVYHPAGLCQMDNQIYEKHAARFCQVCRFLLVDRINPLKHKTVDDEYDSLYPEP